MADLIGAVTKVTSNFLEINQVKHLIFTRIWFFTATIDQVSIDNWGFKLFYKCTTVFLILSSVLTTAKQFFGSPIQCDAGSVSIYWSLLLRSEGASISANVKWSNETYISSERQGSDSAC